MGSFEYACSRLWSYTKLPRQMLRGTVGIQSVRWERVEDRGERVGTMPGQKLEASTYLCSRRAEARYGRGFTLDAGKVVQSVRCCYTLRGGTLSSIVDPSSPRGKACPQLPRFIQSTARLVHGGMLVCEVVPPRVEARRRLSALDAGSRCPPAWPDNGRVVQTYTRRHISCISTGHP